ncbi:MAG: response regulator [Ferruginibacter sp.]
MKKKILLVDDRPDNLMSMESILETGGYELIKASSGREALKILLNEFDFALILMDVKMPNLNGFETAALIYEREKLRHIPIVFITANNYGEEQMFKGYQTGAVDYIYKPVNPELLRTKVAVFVELYTKNHQLIAQEQKLIAINKSLENEINERKLSEAQVKDLNHKLLENIDRLEATNKELDRFAFMSSHDLQEPLRKIRTFNDLLYTKYKDKLDDEAVHYISRIQKAAERMQTLIKDILEFSKVANLKDRFIYTDLKVLVEEVVNDLEPVVLEKKAQININSLPCLDVNPGLMRPLFANLIGNALKYAKKDTAPVIDIDVQNSTETTNGHLGIEKKKMCRIVIKDNGIGFDQKYAEQIFEMFVRLHGNSEYEGTGIGLALCRQIVEKHNGFISALSKENEGSSFFISFPEAVTT